MGNDIETQLQPILLNISIPGTYMAPAVESGSGNTENAMMMMEGDCQCKAKAGMGAGGNCKCGTAVGGGSD
jgi:hypothetical protein